MARSDQEKRKLNIRAHGTCGMEETVTIVDLECLDDRWWSDGVVDGHVKQKIQFLVAAAIKSLCRLVTITKGI